MYKVIIADDEPLILAGLKHKIEWESLGFVIDRECIDGKQLFDAIATERPDLMLVDIQMPNMTGLEVLRLLQDSEAIPTILISGYSDFSYAQEALRYGAIDYLLKPVSSSVLQSAVMKAKKQLDARKTQKLADSDMLLPFLRMNENQLSSAEMADHLSLSGTKSDYWVVAFHGSCKLAHPVEDEVAFLRYDMETTLAVVHTNRLPENYETYLNEAFLFDHDAGVAEPFKHLSSLSERADMAYLLLEIRYLVRGVHLWSTEHEEASINHYLRRVREALEENNAALLAQTLNRLPEYISSHRLSVHSLEVLYNSLLAQRGSKESLQRVHYVTWKELIARYPASDRLIAALYSMFFPADEKEDSDLASWEIILRIQSLLQRDYAQHISLQVYADRFHIDKSYLSTLFHERTNETFTNYLTGIRIRHACEYLKTTSLSHNEIAQMCGFSTDSYMKKVFKKVMGTTPSAYRRAVRESKE